MITFLVLSRKKIYKISYKEEIESKSYNQLDLNYNLDLDKLMDQMEKDHKIN